MTKPENDHRTPLEIDLFSHFERGDFHKTATLLVRHYAPEIFSYLVAILKNEATAADCLSDACESLWKALPTFRGESSFRTWFYTIARHAMHKQMRDPFRKRAAGITSHPEVDDLVQQARTATASYIRTDVKDRFAEVRARLAEDEQTLLYLRVDRKMSWREIAEVMHDPAASADVETLVRESATLRKRFERVKEGLRAMLISPSSNGVS